jgi:glycosyltransferase involved in cell wall biosynthesis
LKRARFITSDAAIMTEKLARLGCDTNRILTVPYGVDLERFHAAADNPERSGPRLLSNRKLEPVYNIETIIDSMAHLTGRFPDTRLLVVGSGSLKRSLLERAKVSSASRSITFLSEVAHARVADLLREYDIYLSMSRSDTTSVSLLEAMACGVFPIVSDIPANHEWIEDGVNGLLVPVEDSAALAAAIERAWNDRTLRQSAAAANARIISERANWQENMAEVERLFERAMQEHT